MQRSDDVGTESKMKNEVSVGTGPGNLSRHQ